MQKLNIFYNDNFAGGLFYDENEDSFFVSYFKEWIKKGFPLAPSIPFENSEDYKKETKAFIDNLLPEGDGLDRLSRYLQISKNNKFALLANIGDETSGAFSFLKESVQQKTSFREISIAELTKRIQNRKNIPISIWDKKPRLSIAGVQEKLPVVKIDNKYGLGSGDLCSTHILKFDKENQNLVFNEFLSLYLAKKAGIDVNEFDIVYFSDELVLEVKRFDREIVSTAKIKKIHVIDACQAIGVPSSFKYERNFGNTRDIKDIREGISFKYLKTLSQHSVIPIIDIKKIINWSIVNLCLGNCDAHGKNISFFYNKKQSITPFYDIMNISIYSNIYDTSLAMAIGDEFDIRQISAYDIALFCKTVNIQPKAYKKQFFKISKTIEKTLTSKNKDDNLLKINNSFLDKYTNNVLKNIKNIASAVNECNLVDRGYLGFEEDGNVLTANRITRR
jgi:serine/threonine-protein kinase HipA